MEYGLRAHPRAPCAPCPQAARAIWCGGVAGPGQRPASAASILPRSTACALSRFRQRGFHLEQFVEDPEEPGDYEPGTWTHFKLVAPPWFTLWLTLQP